MNENKTILADFKKNSEKTLFNFLKSEENSLKFFSSMLVCMDKTPKLKECTKESLFGAFLACAEVGLFPSTWNGDCWIIPYDTNEGVKAQFQLGYKGIKTLAYRCGVSAMGAEVVYPNDEFEEIKGTEPKIIHKPTGDQNKTPIKAYAWAKLNNETVFKVMSKEQIMAIKELSKSKNSKYSPWNSNTDVDYWMWKKSVIKQLSKLLPMTEALSKAVHYDNISERGGYFVKEGELKEQSFYLSNEEKIENINNKKSLIKEKNAI